MVDECRPARIHQLGAGDLVTMGALLISFGEAFNEVEAYGRARPSEEYLRRLL